MSLQDDIFDVQSALRDKPEAAAFERIYTAFGEMESQFDELFDEVYTVRAFRDWLMSANTGPSTNTGEKS